jgi:hypothetical protein
MVRCLGPDASAVTNGRLMSVSSVLESSHEDGDVERSSAEVVDGDLLLALLVESVGQRGGRRLVDDAEYVEARDLAGVLRRLPLRVVEVGGHGDHGLVDLLTQVLLGRLLHGAQDHRGDLRRRVHLAERLHAHVAPVVLRHLVRDEPHLLADLVVAPPHEPLDGEDGVLGVRHGLPLGDLTDEPLPLLGERHNRGRRPLPLGTRYDRCLAALHDGDARVRRSQVDSYYLAHF